MMKILPSNEIREIEYKADQSGISYLRLMENAGSACAKAIRKKFDKTAKRNVTIICGKGKNGGDGFVIARKLAENEYNRVARAVCRRCGRNAFENSRYGYRHLLLR